MALKLLLRSVSDTDVEAEPPEPPEPPDPAVLLLLLLLLQAAIKTAAAPAATAVSPALDTEYNDVPRLFTVTCPRACA
ncbi:MAG TPA: hypothetical protein VG164_00190 [Trebonia sp.]|nr:hypothetical protein [Trebonia sp.]